MTHASPHFQIQAHQRWTLSWAEWNSPKGWKAVDAAFIDWLSLHDPAAYDALCTYRKGPCERNEQSRYLMLIAPLAEAFIVEGFGLKDAYQKLQDSCLRGSQRAQARMSLVRALKTSHSPPEAEDADYWAEFTTQEDIEGRLLDRWMSAEEPERQRLLRCLAHYLTPPHRFSGPQKKVWDALIPFVREAHVLTHPETHPRTPPFAWTDKACGVDEAQYQASYCIYCHKTQGDYCSTGFLNKKHEPKQGVRSNPLGTELHGCPLNQHISEMNLLRSQGYIIASLLAIMVENPLCCLTGQRICNDCSSACIYQKQDPVDIPNVETQSLRDVLSLPWGIEWYLLFLAWNPLHPSPLPHDPTSQRIAVFGLGPAGIASAYHLWRSGVMPVCFDGLAIDPPPHAWVTQPIQDISDWWEPLERRKQKGFGGVAEYGITARWDKNFLTLPWLAFARFGIPCEGGVRLGGTLILEDLWPMGFAHAVLALGAGLPQALQLENSHGKGIRAANDFLMMLHLQGANTENAHTLMDLRLPAVVIGGGLTAVDTATELQAYYIHLVRRVTYLLDTLGISEDLWTHWSREDAQQLRTWYEHGTLLARGMDPQALIAQLGGVTLLYRRPIQEAPCYRSNAHELECALREGVRVIDQHQITSFMLDLHGHISGIMATHTADGTALYIPARSAFVAIGSQPNVAYSYEHPHHLKKDGAYYASASGNTVDPQYSYKYQTIDMMTRYLHGAHRVFYVGDLHPAFHGSVVRALASAKHAVPQILDALSAPPEPVGWPEYTPSILSSTCCTETLYCLHVYAPRHTAHAQPGHIFRLQGREYPLREPVSARVLAWDNTSLTFLVRADTAAALALCAQPAGTKIAVMGPTGVRLRMDDPQETTLILSDSLGLADAACLAEQLYVHDVPIFWAYEGSEEEAQWVQSRFAHIRPVRTQNIAATLGSAPFPWSEIRRVLLQGSAGLLKNIGRLKQERRLPPGLEAQRWLGSVIGPMQCMLKGVCAGCWQWQRDPETGKRSKAVFACSWQDQPLELIDVEHLRLRQEQQPILQTLLRLYHTKNPTS